MLMPRHIHANTPAQQLTENIKILKRYQLLLGEPPPSYEEVVREDPPSSQRANTKAYSEPLQHAVADNG